MPKPYWTIKEVAQQTGLSQQQLRKWEERYGIVQPQRLPNGYRRYSARDVRKLQQMVQWIRSGVHVREAARRLNQPETSSDTPPRDADMVDWESWRQSFWEAGAAMKRDRLEALLQNAIHHFGAERIITHIIRPGLAQIGEWWSSGAWSPDQEQVASEACSRVLLDSWAVLAPLHPAPAALCAAPPGDRHALPPLLLAIEARLRGWDARILGPSPAPGAILRASARWRPVWIAVVATASKRDNPLLQPFLQHEATQLAMGTRVFFGGLGATRDAVPGVISVESPSDLLAQVGSAANGGHGERAGNHRAP